MNAKAPVRQGWSAKGRVVGWGPAVLRRHAVVGTDESPLENRS